MQTWVSQKRGDKDAMELTTFQRLEAAPVARFFHLFLMHKHAMFSTWFVLIFI